MVNKKERYYKIIFPLALLLGWLSLGWIDPLADKIRDGNQLYHNGKYDDALDKYADAQANSPGMSQLDFNMANAQYKRGKFNEAAQLFQKVIKSDEREIKAKASYNMGNTLYRQGKMKEALEWYKRTVDCIDEADSKGDSELDALRSDAKYNYEYVEKKMKEEEQKQQNPDKKDQQEEEQDKKDEQSDENKGDDKEKQESQDKQQPMPQDSQEKNEDKKDENRSQGKKDKQEDQPSGQQQPLPQDMKQMSKEEAERLLEAINQSEKEIRNARKDAQRIPHRSVEKDW